MHPPPTEFRRLTDAEWELLQDRADGFAASIARAQPADWAAAQPFWDAAVAGLDSTVRAAVVKELVKIDLARRWAAGQKPLLDEYIDRLPDLGPAAVTPVDLVCEEYRVRKQAGDAVDVNQYRSRFPAQFDEFRRYVSSEFPANSVAPLSIGGLPPPSDQPPSVNAPGQLPSRVSGSYELFEPLGEGAFGTVWRATAPGGVPVAVKVLNQPVDQEAARREMDALNLVKNLQHPCLLSTVAFWVDARRLYVAMELADGTLRDRFKECQAEGLSGIPADELVEYFRDAAEGLDYLHEMRVIHRDVKPENILVAKGRAKVADFGLARFQQRALASMSFAGTMVYMPPEAFGGKGGPTGDQYALALSYAELRQGRRPLTGDNQAEVMFAHLQGAPDLDPDVFSPAERKAVLRALAKKPEGRYPTCVDFAVAVA